MAHEIKQNDGLVLHRKAAWHGMGTIVEEAPTPVEALQLARLDWSVEQWALSATDGEGRQSVESHRLNLRSDDHTQLGVVGEGYEPVQNRQLAEFARDLAEAGDVVRCESAGSVKGGRRVWFLLKGESFSLRGGDEITPYIMLANGHDGSLAVTAIPTSVRVVCNNTLEMALGRAAGGIRFRHTGDTKSKLDQAKRALGLYEKSLGEFRDVTAALSAKEMTREQLQAFFLDVYARMEGPIPANPRTAAEHKKRDKALQAIGKMGVIFDRERNKLGAVPASAWLAVNAATGWVQNDRTVRGKNIAARAENRLYGKIWGTTSEKTRQAMNAGVALLGA